MINWKKVKEGERDKCVLIINRARTLVTIKDRMGAEMDILAAHLDCPMKLDELLAADDGNFGHDVFGIMENINRKTGKLNNCFVPRFAK